MILSQPDSTASARLFKSAGSVAGLNNTPKSGTLSAQANTIVHPPQPANRATTKHCRLAWPPKNLSNMMGSPFASALQIKHTTPSHLCCLCAGCMADRATCSAGRFSLMRGWYLASPPSFKLLVRLLAGNDKDSAKGHTFCRCLATEIDVRQLPRYLACGCCTQLHSVHPMQLLWYRKPSLEARLQRKLHDKT